MEQKTIVKKPPPTLSQPPPVHEQTQLEAKELYPTVENDDDADETVQQQAVEGGPESGHNTSKDDEDVFSFGEKLVFQCFTQGIATFIGVLVALWVNKNVL